MLTVEKQIIIDLPYRNCWEKVKDISLANNYIPNVEKIEIITTKKEGVGASRKAYLAGGKKVVDETVIEWHEGTGFTLQLCIGEQRALPWFNRFHFRYHIEEADHKTLFRPAILYQPRINFMIGLQKKIYNCALGKELKVICQSMKSYYETGKPTSSAQLIEIRRNI